MHCKEFHLKSGEKKTLRKNRSGTMIYAKSMSKTCHLSTMSGHQKVKSIFYETTDLQKRFNFNVKTS
jgi:hypothetical protein